MDSLWRLASGSSVEEFARDVYIKSNLTIELSKNMKALIETFSESENKLLVETQLVINFCDIIEAILLHGLKEKLTARVSSVFSSKSSVNQNSYQLDFWPIILILCHNEVSRNVRQLANISTDIGRCRAWLRSVLNDGLIGSYLEALTGDSSLLHGFYRSSAYIRDKEHTDIVRNLLTGLDSYVFHLTIDSPTLDSWSRETLTLIGVYYIEEEPSPVVTAVDAFQLIKSENTRNDRKDKSFHRKDKSEDIEETREQFETNYEETASESYSETISDVKSVNLNEYIDEIIVDLEMDSNKSTDTETGNSLSRMSGWSTTPLKQEDKETEQESYDAILQSYSTQAVLSSTPDIRDFAASIDFENPMSRPSYLTKAISLLSTKDQSPTQSSSSDSDFEVIPKSVVFNNSDPETLKFLDQLTKLANESGLDEQDYKCMSCARPIGMIYGKSRLCHFDGHQYCLECHTNDESLIPARIIHNWNFRKYAVAKRNKHILLSIESEPLFDIKILSPLLYSMIPEMKQTLELRTQLFYLHAYLFTCQESIAIEMRKLVWPREHLFEHIHLYSIADLFQVQNNAMFQTLNKVIAFAKKHVLSCPLCTLKGYYCEICKSSQILYPFNTESTKRCEKCKTVFHQRCFNERYDKHSCPKCLRIERREAIAKDQPSVMSDNNE